MSKSEMLTSGSAETTFELPREQAAVAREQSSLSPNDSRPGGSGSAAEEIAGRASRILGNSPYAALRAVACEFKDGILTLNGEVPTFYLKQIAQTMLREVQQVHSIVNNVRVH